MALSIPMSVYGLGLGPMTVKSALDQPFFAEIELVDVGTTSIREIKVNVADPENFEQIGLERAAVLSLLRFTIEKNDHGKEVIKVQSTERMSEPYMELVVDLAWPQGQLYKAYTILLDPPGYHLVASTIQGSPTHYKHQVQHGREPGVIDKNIVTTVSHNPEALGTNKKKSSYGPTVTNENVWQIAQRYKTSELILPQVVLAIVGANPDAFKNGNLNGLKTGGRLVIPSTTDMLHVPADLATAEVMAHDKAWNEQKPIEHVLTTPYTNEQAINKNQAPSSYSANTSTVLPLPVPSSITQLIPNNTTNPLNTDQLTTQNIKPQSMEQNSTTKAELSITIAAVESVREANALLMEQLRIVQKQNTKLQIELDKRNKDLDALHAQIQVLTKQRQALAAQVSSIEAKDSFSAWPYLLFLLLAGGGSGFAYWYLRVRQENNGASDEPVKTVIEPSPFITPLEEIKPEEVQEEKANNSELMVIETTANELKTNEEQQPDFTEQPEEPIDETVSFITPDESEQGVHFDPEPFVTQEMEQKNTEVNNTDETDIDESSIQFIPIEQELEEKVEPDVELALSKVSEEPLVDKPLGESNTYDEFLEFETGLHNTLSNHSADSSVDTLAKSKTSEDTNEGIDFISDSSSEKSENKLDSSKVIINPPKEEQPIEIDNSISQFFVENNMDVNNTDESNKTDEEPESELQAELKKDRLKSKKALETLLALAKTYISMDDLESARHSLEEVLEHGTKKQKEDAAQLLESIKDK
jgi:pilus assembly protein FimV